MWIIAKKAFRFLNPEVRLVPKPGEKMNQVEFEKAVFETKPDTGIQEAPDWIKKDKMWEWASKDGDIMEVVKTNVEPAPAAEEDSKPKSKK